MGKVTPRREQPANKLMVFAGTRYYGDIRKIRGNKKIKHFFAPNFIWNVSCTGAKNSNDLYYLISEIRKDNTLVKVGGYFGPFSTFDYDPEKTKYLIRKRLDLDDVDDSWFLRDPDNPNPKTNRLVWGAGTSWEDSQKYYLDIRKNDVRQAVIKLAVEQAKKWRFDSVNFDNCSYNWSPSLLPGTPDTLSISREEWFLAVLELLKETKAAAKADNLDLIVNVYVPLQYKFQDAYEEIIPYVDGILGELAFHPRRRTDEGLIDELQAYRNVLEAGKSVYLMPTEVHTSDCLQRLKAIRFALTKIRSLHEKYGNIYVLSPTVAYTYEDEPLCSVNTNLVINGNFDDWLDGNPNSWIVSAQSDSNPEVSEVGYTSSGDRKEPHVLEYNGGTGSGACNLYTTQNRVSISQTFDTSVGEVYRFAFYIGPTKPNNSDVIGSLTVMIDNGDTAEHSYDTSGIKTFAFEASKSSTNLKISNTYLYQTTNMTFDDIAIWRELK